jgi:hypothetical protein
VSFWMSTWMSEGRQPRATMRPPWGHHLLTTHSGPVSGVTAASTGLQPLVISIPNCSYLILGFMYLTMLPKWTHTVPVSGGSDLVPWLKRVKEDWRLETAELDLFAAIA